MKKFIVLLALILVSNSFVFAQTPRNGIWKGEIIYSNVEVPFNFEITYPAEQENPLVTIINGEDRAILETTIRNDSMFIPMFGFDITLQMKLGEESMKGELVKHYSGKKYDFKAEFGLPRFEIKEESNPLEIGSKWKMNIDVGKSSEYPAIGLLTQNGNHVIGTIMTEVSDYRFFEGKIEGNELTMSVFDGVHSFLLKGTHDNGKWEGELILDNGYSQKWNAEVDENAELDNPFDIVDLSDKKIKPDLQLLSVLEDEINPDEYSGKVVIIQLMGTWCSNSQDETRFLTDWYKTNSDRELEIIAVNYEANYSVDYGLNRIQTYKNRLGIKYDMILGGPLSKTKAAEPFPFIDKIMAFPTLIFIDKKGYARYVHSYFTGPATGKYYDQFIERFNSIIDELEAE